MNFFKAEPLIDIRVPDHKRFVKIKDTNAKTGEKVQKKLPLFIGEDKLRGEVEIRLQGGKKFEHMGIKVELIGQIDVASDKVISSNFMSLGSDIEPSGTMTDNKTYPFSFDHFQKPYESHYGQNAKLRYIIRVSIMRSFYSDIVKEMDVGVYSYTKPDAVDTQINMDVGIEGILAVTLNFPRSVYHLKDIIEGTIKFSLVKLKIKNMNLNIVKKEVLGSGVNSKVTQEELSSFEIMDGCPAKEEQIPIRFYLSSVDTLGPTLQNVNNKFSVKYMLNLLIIDQEGQKYFKQNEINLYRKAAIKKD